MKRKLLIVSLIVLLLTAAGFGLKAIPARGQGAAGTTDEPLIEAVKRGDAAATARLLSAGADPNAKSAKDTRRPTVLMLAAVGGHREIASALLAKGADVRAGDDVGTTALLYAAEGGQTAVLQELLDAGADVNESNKFGDTALILAAKFGRTDAARLLIPKGAELNAEKRQVFDMLWLKNLLGFDDTTQLYSYEPGDKTARDTDPEARIVAKANAFVVALVHGHEGTAQFLLDRGSRPSFLGDAGGAEVLKLAARRGYVGVVESLLAGKVDVNDAGRNGRTALMEAARFGNVPVMKALLARGAKVEARDAGGLTALLLAARAGQVPALQMLLGAGADLEATDNTGGTALMLAAEAGRADALRALIDKGAKAARKDKLGRTAAQRGEDAAQLQIVTSLGAKDAKGQPKDDGMWP